MRKNLGLPRLVILRVDGGLGSQMQQYALGMAIEKKSGLPVMHDCSWFSQHGKDLLGMNNRNLELHSVFPKAKIRQAPREVLLMFFEAQRVNHAIEPCTEALLSSREPRFMDGYYLGDWYFPDILDEILDVFTFELTLSGENAKTLDQIHGARPSVALHVRRGDFFQSDIHPVMAAEYYLTAMDEMVSRLDGAEPEFFIFSDDMEWARQAFSGSARRLRFVGNNGNDDGRFDMYLMSQCEHFIISASGFSYWAALLARRNPDKIVLRPKVEFYAAEYADWPGWHWLRPIVAKS